MGPVPSTSITWCSRRDQSRYIVRERSVVLTSCADITIVRISSQITALTIRRQIPTMPSPQTTLRVPMALKMLAHTTLSRIIRHAITSESELTWSNKALISGPIFALKTFHADIPKKSSRTRSIRTIKGDIPLSTSLKTRRSRRK